MTAPNAKRLFPILLNRSLSMSTSEMIPHATAKKENNFFPVHVSTATRSIGTTVCLAIANDACSICLSRYGSLKKIQESKSNCSSCSKHINMTSFRVQVRRCSNQKAFCRYLIQMSDTHHWLLQSKYLCVTCHCQQRRGLHCVHYIPAPG